MLHLTDEQLFDYLDGSCTAEEREVCREHLAACSQCQALYDEYRLIDVQLTAIALERAPEHFTETLIDAWQASKQVDATWTYRRSKSLFWAAAMAACTLLVIAFYYLTATQQMPAQVQEQTYTISTKLPGVALNISILTSIFQQEWLVNGFLLVNVLLALLLFDKLMLKPFFEKKRQALAS